MCALVLAEMGSSEEARGWPGISYHHSPLTSEETFCAHVAKQVS